MHYLVFSVFMYQISLVRSRQRTAIQTTQGMIDWGSNPTPSVPLFLPGIVTKHINYLYCTLKQRAVPSPTCFCTILPVWSRMVRKEPIAHFGHMRKAKVFILIPTSGVVNPRNRKAKLNNGVCRHFNDLCSHMQKMASEI